MERKFDKEGELRRLGGTVDDFQVDDPDYRSQHYSWLIPVFYRQAEKIDANIGCFYIEARTTTVKRTLTPNQEVLEFGEIPVAFKQTKEILIKNIGTKSETLRLEPLTPFGGFSVRNAMRTVKPGETKPIVVQFEPLAQQIYDERMIIYSQSTMVSVKLQGTGVRPQVQIQPEDGLISFSNVFVNEVAEKTFTITNISSFPVNFELKSEVAGVENLSKQAPFLMIPSKGTIAAKKNYEVRIVFQPDHDSNNYFDVLLIDIPNQINAKRVYLRGWAYDRQFFVREFDPFVWKPNHLLAKKYEQPLKMLKQGQAGAQSGQESQRQRILLEFTRDEEVQEVEDKFEKAKNRERILLIGNCRMLDVKMEKAGNFEITPPNTQDKYFECDNLKGTVQGAQEQQIKFSFLPPSQDEMLKGIGALKGIGQWVENVWELKLIGGYVEPGQPDPVVVDVVLRAYVEQI
mmetsp:Transcript_1541/g.2718  ORF Transcript_1541/g.2718 Transcript_1541/m.2718 type:complete len:459 (-) Transcript_1541:18-1394(-)